VDVTETALCARLLRAAHRAGVKQAYQDAAMKGAVWSQFVSRAPRAPWGHPDFVLLDAVRAGVLSPQEAWLIGVTRLEGIGVNEVAAVLGERTNTVVVRRRRAEHHLRDAIVAGTVACASDPALLATAQPSIGDAPECEPLLVGVSRATGNRGPTRAPF
jgi:hypothetical protein